MSVPKILISTHQADGRVAQRLKRHLEFWGVEVWLDTAAAGPAEPWPESITNQLAEARAAAVFIGPAGLSHRQKQVIGLALERQAQAEQVGHHFPVVPVLLSGADLAPAFLFSDHWIDLSQNHDEALAALPLAAKGTVDKRPPAVMVDHCPYRGLKPFREEDAAFFFGREAYIDRLASLLDQPQPVVLIGPAGSGKTSLIQAGLIPRLRRQSNPASWWDIVCFRPGDRPFNRLAVELAPLLNSTPRDSTAATLETQLAGDPRALANCIDAMQTHRSGRARLLFVIDHFEELLALTSVAERKAFIETLLWAIKHASVSVVIVLRAEAYVSGLRLGGKLSHWLEGQVVNLGPPHQEEIAAIAQQPARLVTTALQPGLIERLSTATDRLPLLELCLTELWQRHRGGLLRLVDFEHIGGVEGALDRRAEAIYGSFSPPQQRRVQQIFHALTQVTPQGNITCRDWIGLTELCPPQDRLESTQLQRVLSTLSEGGLIGVEQDPFTLETKVKLISRLVLDHWPRLRVWLDQECEFLMWRRRLRQDVDAWEQAERSSRYLLKRALISEAERWLKLRVERLLPTEKTYIQRSATRYRRQRQAAWVLGLATAAILLWAIVISSIRQNRVLRATAAQRDVARTAQAQTELALQTALTQQATAEAQREAALELRQAAVANRLAVQAGLMLADEPGPDLVRGLLLAVESLHRSPNPETEQLLHRGLMHLPRPVARLPHESEVWAAVFSPDGRWLATRGGQVARLWEVPIGEERASLEHAGYLNDMAFSPDSHWLVTASLDHTARLWDVTTGREVARFRHDDRVWSAVFSPDGQWLATRSDQTAYLWRLSSGLIEPAVEVSLPQTSAEARPALFRQQPEQGTLLPETVMTVIGRGVRRMQHQANILDMKFSPDGRWLVTAGTDHLVRVWNVATGQEVRRLAHDGVARTVAFSPDGRWLVSGSSDHTARIWSPGLADAAAAETGVTDLVAETTLPHPDEVNLVTFSPDGRWLATAGLDHSVRVWFLIPQRNGEGKRIAAREVAQFSHADRISTIKFSPDSRWIVSASADHTARISLAATGRALAQMTHADKITDLAFSPDGRWLATAGTDHVAQLWAAAMGYEVAQMAHQDWVLGVAFSADGQTLATRSGRTAQIWEAATGTERLRLDHRAYVNALAFSSAGHRLATANYRAIIVWDADTGEALARMNHGGLVRVLVFSPDGRLLASAGMDKVARIWEAATGQEIAALAHDNWVSAVTFSPDGRWLGTASEDKTARVWDAATGQEVARIAHDKLVNDIAFSPDGQWLATASVDHMARLWLTTTVREIARLPHPQAVWRVAFSSDGRWLATLSGATVTIWEPKTGQHVASMVHPGVVERMVLSPDGRRLATVGGDRTARVWEIATGRELAHLEHEYGVNDAAFSRDGRWLATASADRTARVWLLQQDDLLAEVCARLPYNLSPAEWRQYLPNEPYRATCPNLPVPGE
ncbi:MAG TPA: TIR domain-containing protein [Anaerolineae bacterium]